MSKQILKPRSTGPKKKGKEKHFQDRRSTRIGGKEKNAPSLVGEEVEESPDPAGESVSRITKGGE